VLDLIPTVMPTELVGRVAGTSGVSVAVADFPAPLGALVEIERSAAGPLSAEVIGFREDQTLVAPLGDMTGIRRGDRARLVRTSDWLRVGPEMLGRVVDAQGRPIDGGPPLVLGRRTPVRRAPPRATDRPPIDEPLATGVRALDGLLTCGRGQRLGIFAGAGVGKSTLLGMMARYTAADVNVVALVGERGREVREFLDRDLGPAGLAKSVVVVSTSDEPALVRLRAALAATAIAESFRDAGADVLLVMDSLTRVAQAQREIGLAAGEPPTTRGYPPSVFANLPKLLERAGRSREGSITGVYSVLVEGDDPLEPVSDTVKGLLDGHVRLSRALAARGQFPAVDVLESISRLMPALTTPEHRAAAQTVRELLETYRRHEDLLSIGAYRAGSQPKLDRAIALRERIDAYLSQGVDAGEALEQSRRKLLELAAM
jgi:flagellum-specific ATP synthase